MKTLFRPILAYGLIEEDLPNLKFPLILQSKLDGIRCIILEGRVLSRKLKLIPNKFIRDRLEHHKFDTPALIDGELIIEGKTFNEIQSAVMSEEGEPNFIYKVFDCLKEWNSVGYEQRLNSLSFIRHPNIEFLNSITVHNLEELLEWESYILKDGYEGIILRSPNAPYKFGRSTLKEQSLMKFKHFQDSEAIILSSNALLSNTNELEQDELGYAKRSSRQVDLIAEEKLGSWNVMDCNKESPFYNGIFNIGTGFDNDQRLEFWLKRNEMVNRIIKYKYQLSGSKNKPRLPIFLGFRKD